MTVSRVGGLRGRVKGVMHNPTAITVGSVMTTNMIRIVSNVVLTRLLDSEAFGIVGFVTSMTFVVAMLSDIGVIAFVVRHQDGDDPRFLDEVWTIRIFRSVALTLLMMSLAVPMGHYVGDPRIAPVVFVWSFTFMFDGLSSLVIATRIRARQLFRVSAMDIIIALVNPVVSITLALIFRNYWALVLAAFPAGLLKCFLTYAMFPGSRRRFRISRERTREMWGFSRFIAASSMLTALIAQFDKLVLARLFPLEIFGLYSIAAQLAAVPTGMIGPFVNRVLYPHYAKTFREAPERLREVFYGERRFVSWAYMFAIGGMIGGAPLVVRILYDPRYAGVAPMLRILAVAPFFLLNNWSANEVLVAKGNTRNMLHLNIVRCAWLAGAGAIGTLTLGPLGLIIAVGTMEAAGSLFIWWTLSRHDLLDLRQELICIAIGVAGIAVGEGVSAIGLKLVPV